MKTRSSRLLRFARLALVVPACLTAAAGVRAAETKWTVNLEEVARSASDRAPFRSIAVSPDARRVGFITAENGGAVVYADKTRLGRHRSVAGDRLVFSPQGNHLAYVAIEDTCSRVVVDGKPGADYDLVHPESLVFSPAEDRLAYVASREGRWFAVIGETVSPPWEGIAWNSLRFNADGSSVVYAARDADGWHIVQDGVPGPPLAGLQERSVQFVPGGKSVAAVGRAGGQWAVFVDGIPGPVFEAIFEDSLVFSRDGAHCGYLVRSEGRARAVFDGQTSKPYEAVSLPRISADGTHFGFMAERGGKNLVVVDGAEGQDCDEVFEFYLSATGEPVYSAFLGGKVVVFRGDKASAGYEGLTAFVVSEDGLHSAFVGRNGDKVTLVKDGVAATPCDQVLTPVFGPSGQLAYHARFGNNWKLVLEGQSHDDDAVARTAQFSPEGRHVISFSLSGKKWFARVDGEKLKRTLEIAAVGKVVFEGEERMRYIGFMTDQKGLVFQRVTISR